MLFYDSHLVLDLSRIPKNDTFIYFWISGRPWLEDSLDEWVMRLQEGPVHKCAAIFVDNSGVDIVLGILPFVRDLLQRGTNVRI